MKKNAMLKIAAVLLVAVLLTTCAISSTFAKYTSTDSSSEASARVAKWGLVVDATLKDGFGKSYVDGNKIVSSAGTDNVVAPGTNGKITLAATYSGSPEVSYSVVCDATVNTGSVPIVFTYDGQEYNASQIAAKIEEVFSKANVNPATAANTNNTTMVIDWAWDFEDDDPDGSIRDNALGNAYLTGTQETISMSFKLDVFQTGAAGEADEYLGADN